jgi:hypothetical protein
VVVEGGGAAVEGCDVYGVGGGGREGMVWLMCGWLESLIQTNLCVIWMPGSSAGP